MYTFFLLPSNRSIIRFSTSLPAAGRIVRNLQLGVIRVWLLDDRLCGGCRRGNGGGKGRAFRDGLDSGDRRRGLLNDLGGLGGRCVVDFGVFARGARWDGEEFLKG